MRRISFKRIFIGDLTWQRLVRSLVLIYLVFAVYVFFRADSMIFSPQPASYQDSPEILKLPVTDRDRISALHLPNPQATYTLLYSHGNAEDLGDVRPGLDRLHDWGWSVFAYDYRGYGTSDGRPSERHAYQDIDAAYRYLTETLKIAPQNVILYGRSVGGGPTVELATRRSVAGVILESTFTSAFRVVVPFPLLPFDKFPNLKRLPQVDRPILVMHGLADEIIPSYHGRMLYEAASPPKQSLWVEEAGHNDFTWVAGPRHQQALTSFRELVDRQR